MLLWFMWTSGRHVEEKKRKNNWRTFQRGMFVFYSFFCTMALTSYSAHFSLPVIHFPFSLHYYHMHITFTSGLISVESFLLLIFLFPEECSLTFQCECGKSWSQPYIPGK